MGMLMAQAKKVPKAQEEQDAQPPNGQSNVKMITMEQAILNNLGLVLRTVANIERQQLILGGKIDEVFKKLNE